MLVSEEHSENAEFPIEVTLSGIVMLARFEQPENARTIEVTPSGIVYSVSPAGAKKLRTPSIIRHLPSSMQTCH